MTKLRIILSVGTLSKLKNKKICLKKLNTSFLIILIFNFCFRIFVNKLGLIMDINKQIEYWKSGAVNDIDTAELLIKN